MGNNKIMAVMVVVLLLAVAGITAFSLTKDGGDSDAVTQHRVMIYGNANGDDQLDQADIDVIEDIIADGTDTWKTENQLADANQDGKVTDADADVVRKYLNKEKTRLYYENAFNRVTWVNYPLGLKIGTETASIEFLKVLDLYDHLYATDSMYTITKYPDKYPGAQDKVIIGSMKNFTVEGVRASGVESLFLYPVHGDYFWDKAEASGLADKVSIIILDTQGDRAVGDVLMLGVFFNKQPFAEKYAKWYDGIVEELSIIGDTVPKKEVNVINGFSSGFTKGEFMMCGSDFHPVGHYHHILDFQAPYIGSNKTVKFEDFVNTGTDDVIVILHRNTGVSLEGFDYYSQGLIEKAFPHTKQLKEGNIYAIEWECSPNLGGIAGMYILASYLYPDHFDTEKGYEHLQYFLDNFHSRPGMNAHVGFFHAVTPVE